DRRTRRRLHAGLAGYGPLKQERHARSSVHSFFATIAIPPTLFKKPVPEPGRCSRNDSETTGDLIRCTQDQHCHFLVHRPAARKPDHLSSVEIDPFPIRTWDRGVGVAPVRRHLLSRRPSQDSSPSAWGLSHEGFPPTTNDWSLPAAGFSDNR